MERTRSGALPPPLPLHLPPGEPQLRHSCLQACTSNKGVRQSLHICAYILFLMCVCAVDLGLACRLW